MDSNRKDQDLVRRIAILASRLEDGEDNAEAVDELDELIRSDREAARIYLDTIRITTELPYTDVIESRGLQNELLQPPLSPVLSFPARFARIAVWPIAAALVVGVFVFSLRKAENGIVESGPTLAHSTETESKQGVPREMPGIGSATVVHPAKTGRVKGGVVVSKGSIPETVTFNAHVRSILSENCFFCHGPDANKREGELRLDSFEDAIRDRDGYQVIAPGNAAESELILRLLEESEEDVMPPPDSGRVVTAEQRRILERWIEQGAEYEGHWAFISPLRSEVPKPENSDWTRNPIDSFILSRLEEESIAPSSEADRRTLLRRLSLDLIGLPPTPEEIASFMSDTFSGAYERQVERLLASPHFGERMALPWLDAARYADSNGFQQDGDRHAWPWRDWVVDSMNENKPFDQFTIEQIAGDLLGEPTNDQLIATSFNRNHMLNNEGGAIPEEQRNNYVFDRVDTTATTWLGMTMACAQCHDHKYDALTQKDYYRFSAYFNNVPEGGRADYRANRIMLAEPVLELPTEDQAKERDDFKARIQTEKEKLDAEELEIAAAQVKWEIITRENPPKSLDRNGFLILRNTVTEGSDGTNPSLRRYYLENDAPEEWKAIQKTINQLNNQLEKVQAGIVAVMIMEEREERRETFVLNRGDYESPGESVLPGTPEALFDLETDAPSNRLGLAEWLVSPENPLTARVIVNRYWQHHFGTGLVKTAEDFGVQGEQPSHPALLDWLATEFVETGWDMKHMHRLMVTSATYRQSSKARPELVDVDPENRLLARGARFRLPAMLIRDSALFASGLLRTDVGGRPVYPYQPEGLWHEFSFEQFSYTPSSGTDLYRRSLYTFWRRTIGPPNMFDSPNRQVCQVKGATTNTPLHALTTLNDPTFVEAARVFAERILTHGGETDETRLSYAFRQALGRDPSDVEAGALNTALERSRSYYRDSPDDAAALATVGESDAPEAIAMEEYASYTNVAQIIFNTDEFLTRE